MSRADEVRAAYAAELALAEAEDQLVRLKESGDAEALAEHKRQLRAMRQSFREERAGSAVAQPATVEAVAEAADVEGTE